jgi:hypothetical protein
MYSLLLAGVCLCEGSPVHPAVRIPCHHGAPAMNTDALRWSTNCEIVCWGVILAISAGPTPCMYQYSGYRAGRSSGQCHTGRTTLITPSVHTSASLFGYLYLGPCTRPTATQPNRDVTTHYCWPVHTSCMPASRSYVKT